jgi:anaerobic magnesium-protoporphyrin IX monomethyl ester cyclase
MKVHVLNPPYFNGFCRSARWAAKSRGRVQRHPDWLLIAAAYLEKHGHEVHFTDGAALNLSRDQVRREFQELRPDLVVCHTTTPSIYNDISYARLAKDVAGARTALVGAHVSAEPDDTFRHADGAVDAIVRGEYELPLRQIADAVPLRRVASVSWLDGDRVVHNPPGEPIDVNELPFPAWHFVRPEWYPDLGKRMPFLTLISARGCRGRCTFCRDTPLLGGRTIRCRQAGLVVDEIESDYRQFPQIREIMFETDTFAAWPDHCRQVCQEILRRGVKVTWSCNVRVDTPLDLLPDMKHAGCRMLMIGFEFGTQEQLDSVHKDVTVEQSREFAQTAHRLGFVLHGCFMIGAPGETHDSARATIEFAKSLPLDTVQISGICVYPGTEMYRWAKQHGYLVAKDWTEWLDRKGEQVVLLNYPQLSNRDMDAYINRGLRQFYLRPGQVVRMLVSLRDLGDVRRKVHGLRSFVDSVLSK